MHLKFTFVKQGGYKSKKSIEVRNNPAKGLVIIREYVLNVINAHLYDDFEGE